MAALCHTCVVLWGVVHKTNTIFLSLLHLKGDQAAVNMLMVFLLVLALKFFLFVDNHYSCPQLI